MGSNPGCLKSFLLYEGYKNQFTFGFAMKRRMKRKGKIWQKTIKVETIWNPICNWPIDVVKWQMDPPLKVLQLFLTTFSTFWNDNLIPNLFLFIFPNVQWFVSISLVVEKSLKSCEIINCYKNYRLDMSLYLFW